MKNRRTLESIWLNILKNPTNSDKQLQAFLNVITNTPPHKVYEVIFLSLIELEIQLLNFKEALLTLKEREEDLKKIVYRHIEEKYGKHDLVELKNKLLYLKEAQIKNEK